VLAQGVIYDPTKNELFRHARARRHISTSGRIRCVQAHPAQRGPHRHGISFRDFDASRRVSLHVRELTRATAGIRRAGAAALDIAYVAAGRLDGFWEMAVALGHGRGRLMVQEAGGLVGDFRGDADYLSSGRVI